MINKTHLNNDRKRTHISIWMDRRVAVIVQWSNQNSGGCNILSCNIFAIHHVEQANDTNVLQAVVSVCFH